MVATTASPPCLWAAASDTQISEAKDRMRVEEAEKDNKERAAAGNGIGCQSSRPARRGDRTTPPYIRLTSHLRAFFIILLLELIVPQ